MRAGTRFLLDNVLNGDIRTIYRQEYLSPRPNTCSLRLSTDGYSTWQMSGSGQHKVPEVTLDQLAAVTDAGGHVVAGKGVPFGRLDGAKNIAFTSSWDNWPKQVTVPINKTGDAVWFLLCGTTNPMEVRIANAELRMKYADGVVEKLALVPPFNFWTLCPIRRDWITNTCATASRCRKYLRPRCSSAKTAAPSPSAGSLRPGVALESVTLETLSDEVVHRPDGRDGDERQIAGRTRRADASSVIQTDELISR